MEEILRHLSFPPAIEITVILSLLSEMQAALLRKPNPQFESFVSLVDRKKRELYMFRQNISRDVVLRSVCVLLPKELEVTKYQVFSLSHFPILGHRYDWV